MTYVWYKDGEQLLNTNSSTLDFPAFAGEHVGGYCCQISNTYGADVSQSAELALGRFNVNLGVYIHWILISHVVIFFLKNVVLVFWVILMK